MKELERLIPDDPLECLKVLKTSANTYCCFNNDQCEYNKKLADNIEKVLKRLKEIDNSNPNEALEELENIIEEITIYNADLRNTLRTSISIASIKQALLDQEKVLKIIFEKRVDMWHLVDLLDQTYEMYVAFCKSEKYDANYILTKEEFDAIKRWRNERIRSI